MLKVKDWIVERGIGEFFIVILDKGVVRKVRRYKDKNYFTLGELYKHADVYFKIKYFYFDLKTVLIDVSLDGFSCSMTMSINNMEMDIERKKFSVQAKLDMD